MGGKLRRIAAVAVVLAALLACALVVGDGEGRATAVGWVPLLAVLAALAANGLFVLAARHALSFDLRCSATDCRRGEALTPDVTFRNRFPLVLQSVEATFVLKAASGTVVREQRVLLSLGPRGTESVAVPMAFEHVGTFSVGLGSVRVEDILGLASATVPGLESRRVRVAPRLVEPGAVDFSEEALLESKKAAKSVLADSHDYAYVRDYVIGDPLKSIHWKLSARTGSYYTRLYEMSANPGAVVVLDFFVPSDDHGEAARLLDAVVEAGLSVARWAQARGMDVEIRYADSLGETVVHDRWDDGLEMAIVGDLPDRIGDEALRGHAPALVRSMVSTGSGQSNVVVCSANVEGDMVGAVIDAALDRRAALFLAAIPVRLVDRDRDEYCRSLRQLDDCGAAYVAFSDAEELAGAVIP